MNKSLIIALKLLRRIYSSFSGGSIPQKPLCERDPDIVSDIIFNELIGNKPTMIARYGAFELKTVTCYLDQQTNENRLANYLKGESEGWWWDSELVAHMQNNAGFFPPTEENLGRFSQLMLNDSKYVDILGSWLPREKRIDTLPANHTKVDLELLNPFFSNTPWTKALKDKKVLVVHPFVRSIREQYQRKDEIFPKGLLPDFDLKIIPAVQSIGGQNDDFRDWFEALDFMKQKVAEQDFDICLLGCGAYGFPLAAHIKRQGKKAFHLGGSLQLLFGIRGARWENPNYNRIYNYSTLMNEYWVKPKKDETPQHALQVEGACYW